MTNPSNTVFSITFHNPPGGNLQMFVVLVPTDNTGNPTNQPFAQKSDSIGNAVETDPSGNPMSQDKNAGFPKSVGTYSYLGGNLKIYMVGVTSRSPLLSANASFFFDGYFAPSPTSIFSGNLKGMLQRGSMYLGPGSQGSNYFMVNGACTISASPYVKPV